MVKSIRKLAIVGASARAAAFSALRAGYEVVAADLFADADLSRECSATRVGDYPDSLADWLAQTSCDAWIYTGALENYPDLIDQMAALRPLLGNGGESLRTARKPLVLQDLLLAAGLSFPETVAKHQGLTQDGAWLCKTYRTASGLGVWPLDGPAAMERAIHADAVYQRRIQGEYWDAAAIFILSERQSKLVGLSQQLVGQPWAPRPWQYAGSIGPATISPALHEQLIRLAGILARQVGLRGIVGVDLVMQDERAWVVEVNPRYTASVEAIERMTGKSAIARHITAFDPSESPVDADEAALAARARARSFGKAIVFAKSDVMISDRFHSWAIGHASVDPEIAMTADVPQAGEHISKGHPILTVFTDGPRSGCIEQLRQCVAEVESRIYS
jgi:uncharacterized protein